VDGAVEQPAGQPKAGDEVIVQRCRQVTPAEPPIGRVGQYDSITRGVRIVQAPTTIVIDRNRRTRVITGLTERQELEQAVGDALAGR